MKKAIEKKAYSMPAATTQKTASKPKAAVAAKKAPAKPKAKAVAAEPKSLKKQYAKSNSTCKVTFRLPKEAADGAQVVTVVGDFNNWSTTENRMTKLKSGEFTLTIELPSGEYRFKYLIDADRWENDWFADKYIPNEFGTDDSVVVV